MRKKSRAGRDFEELIARIERILAPNGAIIKSPDYILDLITNSLREVDISIRFQDNNESRLITVECRDRVGQQDTTWIEQLVTKQKDIGAWRTYAVSSGKFSKPAIKKANHYGIEIRLFDQITDAEISQEWNSNSSKLNIEITKPFIYLANFTVTNKDRLTKEFIETLKNDLSIIDYSDYFSDSDLRQIKNWLAESNNTNELFHFSLSFHYCLEIQPSKNIESDVTANYFIKRQIIKVPVQSVQQYSSPEGIITQFIEGNASDDTHLFKVKMRGRFKSLPVKERRSKR
jgi:hypothetical protein